MPHHCDRHFELSPEYWRHVYVDCQENETGRFIFTIADSDAVVVNFCPICGEESPAHKAEQGVFDAYPYQGVVEYPEVTNAISY